MIKHEPRQLAPAPERRLNFSHRPRRRRGATLPAPPAIPPRPPRRPRPASRLPLSSLRTGSGAAGSPPGSPHGSPAHSASAHLPLTYTALVGPCLGWKGRGGASCAGPRGCVSVCVYLYACVSVRACHCRDWAVRGRGGILVQVPQPREGGHSTAIPFPSRRRRSGTCAPSGRDAHWAAERAGRRARARGRSRKGPRAPAQRQRRERGCVSRPPLPPPRPTARAGPEGTRPAVPAVCSHPRPHPRPRGPGGALRRRVPALTAPPMPARRCRGRGHAGPARTGRAAAAASSRARPAAAAFPVRRRARSRNVVTEPREPRGAS